MQSRSRYECIKKISESEEIYFEITEIQDVNIESTLHAK